MFVTIYHVGYYSVLQYITRQQSPARISADMIVDSSGKKEQHVEKDSFPTQLYRHVKVKTVCERKNKLKNALLYQ